ncbi:MAG TPA: imidazolonepropionase [Chitinophagaceae bacterium]
MKTLFANIAQLACVHNGTTALRGQQLSELRTIPDAYLLVEDGMIAAFGEMKTLTSTMASVKDRVDASGKIVLPAWCDSHTHLVFAATRENEFVDKLKGLSYADIARRGGGILNSAAVLRDTNEDDLYAMTMERLREISGMGTGAVEIKSGYGLSVEGELKMLRVIKRLKQDSPLLIRATFLGAHSVPPEFRENPDAYVDVVINEMLPVIKRERLADFIDVFCETGFFTVEQLRKIIRAGHQAGLHAKVHVNQLNAIGGVEAAVSEHALTVDHLETMTKEAIESLSGASTIATLLPTAAFFLRMNYPPARELIDRGCAVSLASDFNPGSSPSGNMQLVIAMACIQMRMLPAEAINAATFNGAFAMNVDSEAGSIAIGKRANLIVTKPLSSLTLLPYYFGSNLVDKVFLSGIPLG